MWKLRIKFTHKDSAIIPFAKKYNLVIMGFPMNRFEKGGYVYLTNSHIVFGDEGKKKAYFEEVKGNRRYENVEQEGNLIVYTLKAKKGATHLQMYLNPELIFLKPIIVKPDGFEYLEVGALRKAALTEFLKIAQKWVEIEIQQISNEKIRDLYIPHAMPDLTEKQKNAIILAYKNGFYDFPKKIDIAGLAKIAKLGQSTFQEHLRKAEQKLIPFFLENIAHDG